MARGLTDTRGVRLPSVPKTAAFLDRRELVIMVPIWRNALMLPANGDFARSACTIDARPVECADAVADDEADGH